MTAPTHLYDLIILDRDGVINHDSDDYIKSVEEWQPIPGSIEAIARLSQAGYPIGIATNQSGLARGYFDLATLEGMHAKFDALLKTAGGDIHHIAFCPHAPHDDCDCRKPKPGLLDQISTELNIPLGPNVIMVGDNMADLEVGIARSCDIVLLKTGKGLRSLEKIGAHPDVRIRNVRVFDNLAAFVDTLLQGKALYPCPS